MTDQHDAAPPPRAVRVHDAPPVVSGVNLRSLPVSPRRCINSCALEEKEADLARVTAERDELRRIVALHRERALAELAAIDADLIDSARPAP